MKLQKRKEDDLKLLCEERKMDLFYVWSDENKNDALEKMKDIIHARI